MKYWCDNCLIKFSEPAMKKPISQYAQLLKDVTIKVTSPEILCCPGCYSAEIAEIVEEGKKEWD